MVWLNYGDAYSAGGRGGPIEGSKQATNKGTSDLTPFKADGFAPKNLMMMPARVAMALQNDGWILRKEIIWRKPNPLPESVKDRPTSSHEKVFLFAQQPRYFYDDVAVRDESDAAAPQQPHEHGTLEGWNTEQSADHVTDSGNGSETSAVATRQLRDVWTIPIAPFPGAHFATFPTRLVEPCIKAGTSEHGVCAVCGAPWLRQTETFGMAFPAHSGRVGTLRDTPEGNHQGDNRVRDGHRPGGRPIVATTGWEPGCGCDVGRVAAVVLDPFGGAGTVGVVAHRLGRDAVLCELLQRYAEMAAARINDDAPMLNNTEIVLNGR